MPVNQNSFIGRAKRNPAESSSHREDPYSEIRDMPKKSKVYHQEKEEMDGFGVRARRGVNPAQVKRGSHDDID